MAHDVEMVPGLKAAEIDLRIRDAIRRGEVSKRVQAYYFVELQRSNRLMDLGHSSLRSYARSLGVSSSQLRDLILVGRALAELEIVDQAFGGGEINWSQTRLLTRICIPETQEGWLAFAAGRSVRELEEEVSRSQRGCLPGEGHRLPRAWYRISANLDFETHELWEQIQDLFEDEKGTPGKSREVLREVFELFLAQKKSAAEPQEKDGVRREVLKRDEARCTQCGSHYRLNTHHLQWRSRGGETSVANLLTLCDRCHSLVHSARLHSARLHPAGP